MLAFLKKIRITKNTAQNANLAEKNEKIETGKAEQIIAKMEKYGVRNTKDFARGVLSLIAHENEIMQAVFFVYDEKSNPAVLRYFAGYACNDKKVHERTFRLGEGFPGQVIKDKKILKINNVPDGYITIETGLGAASPSSLLLVPLFDKDKTWGVLELAGFKNFSDKDVQYFHRLAKLMGKKIKELQEETVFA